jgi:hypothetical protein
MGKITLADPFLKTARAKEHLDSLKAQLVLFRDSKPHRFSTERDIDNQRYHIHLKVADVPDSFPLIVGDFLYCLRSSLDQLVWALAKLTKPYPRGTQFPILDVPDEKKFREWTRGVPTDAKRVIKSLQPYHGGQNSVKSHLLWRLNKLGNIDKHRRLAVRGDVSEAFFPDLPHESWHLVEVDNAGTVSAPLHLESKMKLHPSAFYDMIFGDSFEGIECDIEGLNAMYEFVANSVIPRFSRFFK